MPVRRVAPKSETKKEEQPKEQVAAPSPKPVDELLTLSAATLVYGDTGSGKTTLLETFAVWVWKKWRVVTRYYAFDPGGFSDGMLALVRKGIVEVWRVYTRDPEGLLGLPSETLVRAAQGWWPAEIDPATGYSPLGVKLIPNPPQWRGAAMYDGLSGMCDWSMVDMGARSAAGTLGGEQGNMRTVDSGDLKLGVGNRASVGFTQNKVRDWIVSSLSIRGLVHAPVFTALELKTTDQETKLPTYGPKIAGQAKTTDVPSWFGNCLGVVLAKDVKGKEQWRLYLRTYNYPDNDRTPHPAKVRTAAAYRRLLPEFLADAPDAPALTTFNLGGLFELLEKIREQALADAEIYTDAPGLKASTLGSPTAGPERVVSSAGGPPRMVRVSAAPPPAVEPAAQAAPDQAPPGFVATPISAQQAVGPVIVVEVPPPPPPPPEPSAVPAALPVSGVPGFAGAATHPASTTPMRPGPAVPARVGFAPRVVPHSPIPARAADTKKPTP